MGSLAERNVPTLESCEVAIQASIDSVQAHYAIIGAQLTVIRDGELYTDDTFEAYCERRWRFSRSHAYRLIQGAEVVANLEDGESEAPATERQAREVAEASGDPGEQREVWETAQEIAGTEQPAAPVIRQAAEIVQTGTPINHESIELTAAITAFTNTVNLLTKRGQEIQNALAAKVAVSKPMATRQVKLERMISNMAGQVDILAEHIKAIGESWERTKKQVDE